MNLVRFVGKRLLQAVLVLFALSILVYIGIDWLPGDPARTIAGGMATQEQLDAIRAALDLDRPVTVRYWEWLTGMFRGDFGYSYTQGSPFEPASRVPVADLVLPRALNSLILAAASAVVIYPLAVLLGTVSAAKRGTPTDSLIGGITLTLIALPEFIIGIILVLLFSILVQVFPAVSRVSPSSTPSEWLLALALPVATITAAFVAQITRLSRATVSDALQTGYVQYARLAGVPEKRVVVSHALRNTWGPSVQAMGLNFAYLLGGLVVVEQLFGYPGLGSALLTAVRGQDLPVVLMATLIIATAFVLVNLAADILAAVLNPRMRRNS